MKSTLRYFMACCTAIMGLNSAIAIGEEQGYSGWSWSGNIDHINISSEAANKPGILIDESATALGVAAEYFTSTNSMTYSLGLSYILYNDNNEFAEYVHDYWGGSGYEESDANALMAYAEIGPKLRFGDGSNFFTARGGISGIFASTRSIANCDNCYSEDIDIEGGLYGVLGVGRSFNQVALSLQFQQYFTGDLDNSVRFKISSTF